jgi:hypothetical protein
VEAWAGHLQEGTVDAPNSVHAAKEGGCDVDMRVGWGGSREEGGDVGSQGGSVVTCGEVAMWTASRVHCGSRLTPERSLT